MDSAENIVRVLASAIGVITLFGSTMSAMLLSRKAKGRISGKGMGLRSSLGIFIITIGLITVGTLLWKPIPLYIPGQTLLGLTVIGAIIYFSGIGLYLWGMGTMRSQFAVSNLFGAELYKEHKLVTSGPFAFVRHPLYIGVILTAIGALLIFKTWAMAIFTPMSFVVIGRAEREEELLKQEFGSEWEAYKAKVPKWIPKV